jgi:hypothetical protein
MGFIELAIFFEFSLQKVRSIKLIRAVAFTMPTVYTLGNKLHHLFVKGWWIVLQ